MKALLRSITILLLVFAATMSFAQVAVNTDGSSADASAMLEVKSSDKGILIPRMTALERDNISNPATGLLVFVTDEVAFNYYDGSMWSVLGSGASVSIPVGTIEAFAGSTIPDGWLLCDGSAISRTTYSDLFAVIDTKWGAGDGSTSFHIPDLRGRFLRGVDHGAGNDPDASSRSASNTLGNTGDNVGSLQADELKSHSHAYTVGYGSGNGSYAKGTNSINSAGYTGTTGGNETRPKNVYVNYIIKY